MTQQTKPRTESSDFLLAGTVICAGSAFIWYRLGVLEREGGSTLAILVFLHGLLGRIGTVALFGSIGLACLGVGLWQRWKGRTGR